MTAAPAKLPRRVFSAARDTGVSRALPYLLLAPAVLTVLAIFVYPLIEGIRSSTQIYRFGNAIESVGLENYKDVLGDAEFRSALWITLKFVFLAVALETVIGLGLALFCARELPFIRALRSFLIIPMVIAPVAIGIVFRTLYASDVGLFTTVSEGLGGGAVHILSAENTAFLGLVALDVWEWTPLIFIICLAGIQSLPVEPFEAARVDGASRWRTFWDHTLPMLRPVLTVAIVLRTIEAFATFDQPFVLTGGGPGTSTKLISLHAYETAFKFQDVGFAAAMLIMVGLVVLAVSVLAVKLLRRTAERGVAP